MGSLLGLLPRGSVLLDNLSLRCLNKLIFLFGLSFLDDLADASVRVENGCVLHIVSAFGVLGRKASLFADFLILN